MKYVDADKLTKAIEEKGLDCSFALKMERLDTLALIDSLQQEQPDTNGDDGKFVKILVRREFAEQFQRLGDEIQAGQSSFIEAMNQQEQPEVDLERAFAHEYAIYHLPNFIIASIVDGTELFDFIYKTARHFFVLGLNARKEN